MCQALSHAPAFAHAESSTPNTQPSFSTNSAGLPSSHKKVVCFFFWAPKRFVHAGVHPPLFLVIFLF